MLGRYATAFLPFCIYLRDDVNSSMKLIHASAEMENWSRWEGKEEVLLLPITKGDYQNKLWNARYRPTHNNVHQLRHFQCYGTVKSSPLDPVLSQLHPV
jgi:hypothetical protein